MKIIRKLKPVLIVLALAISNSLWAGDSKVTYYPAPNDTEGSLPFSDAVKVGDLLILSGKLGNIPGTRDLAKGGIAGQTRQTMDNIKATLKRYNLTMDNVVKCTVFMDDISQWADMNKVYVTYFKKHKPARSALGADGLALGALVEIECMAAY